MKSVNAFNLLLVILLGSLNPLAAQEKTFEREYTYKASDLDSKISCRAIVVNQLRSTLLNEIGVYVESEQILKTSDVSGKFSQDFVENIATISAGITNLKILEEKWNGESFWMKASITVDKRNLEESLKQLIADRQKLKELEETKQRLNNATKQLDSLKNIVSRNKLLSQKEQSDKYNSEIKKLSATDYYYASESKYKLKDYDGALSDLSSAIEIDPNFSQAYYTRAWLKCRYMSDTTGAIVDYTKAIEIDPTDAHAYNGRGTAKADLKDYKGAIADYNKAIDLDHRFAFAIYNLGKSKHKIHDYHGAISDFIEAIEIDPKNKDFNSNSYNSIGAVKQDLKDFPGAIASYSKAIELSPKDKRFYYNRAGSKLMNRDPGGSIADCSKAIEIDPNYSDAYLVRGLAKLPLKQNSGACRDIAKAAELGNTKAPEVMKEYCK